MTALLNALLILQTPHHSLVSLIRSLRAGRTPGQLVIQLTDRCNARCPQCGMRVTKRFSRSSLSLDDLKRILDAAAQNEVSVVSFTGGEPLLMLNDLVAAIDHAAAAGIRYIRTGTNGFIFMDSGNSRWEARIHRVAERLAHTKLRNFWISVDSSIPEVHERMRGLPGVIRGIEKGLQVFHEHGIYPSANLGINRQLSGETMTAHGEGGVQNEREWLDHFFQRFRQGFGEFYQFVIDLGFTIVNCCYPMSSVAKEDNSGFQAVYRAVSADSVVRFTRGEKAALFKAVLAAVPRYRAQTRIFSPRAALYALFNQYDNGSSGSYGCRGGIDYFFINSRDGNTYPCGYRGGENLGKYWEMDRDALDGNAVCRQCDWECFRDPSELFGPLLQVVSSPQKVISKVIGDRRFLSLWIDDVRYYRACDLFDGRKPPDYRRLREF